MQSNRDDIICIGKISKPHGTRGEVKIVSYSDYPDRFKELKEVYVELPKEIRTLSVESCRDHNGQILLKFRGIDSIDDAEKIRGGLINIDEKDIYPLPEGHFYHFQLIGMEVTDSEKGPLGLLTEIIETGANDVFVVESDKYGEILIPFIPHVVLEINVAEKAMFVKLLPGLIDEA